MKRYYAYPDTLEPQLKFSTESIARGFSLFAIFLCIFLVFGNLAANAYFDPKASAERELQYLAKDYYENYYYDILTSADLPNAVVCSDKEIIDEEGNPSVQNVCENPIFSQYDEGGLPRVYLRQLLLFDNGRHSASRQIFNGEYTCNTNHTAIIIQPVSPYGRTDYTVKYEYECNWKDQTE